MSRKSIATAHTSQTRKRLALARLWLAQGTPRVEVRRRLMDQCGICYRSADRTIRLIAIHQERRAKQSRTEHLNEQRAKLNLVQETAFNRTKVEWSEAGESVEVPDPDLGVVVNAVREENKLLDLYAHDEEAERWAKIPFAVVPVDPEKLPSLAPAAHNGNGNGSAPLPRFSQGNGSS